VRIISRSFLASYLRLFFTILIGSLLAIAVVEMLLEFEDVVESRTLAGIATYFLLRIPSGYLRDILPVSSFLAALLCIGGPARAREITALKAGGVSPRRIVMPVVLASLALSLLAFALNESLVLWAQRGLEAPGPADAGITFRRGSFWYHRGDVVYNIRDADRDTNTLHGVSVFRLGPDGRLLESLHADRVSIEDGAWVLDAATRRSFDPARPEAAPASERVSEKALDLGSTRDFALLNAQIDRLSLGELREYIEMRAADGRDTLEARSRLQRRLADPLTVTLFAWLALPLGFAVERARGFALPGLLGLACLSVYFSLRTAESLLASAGVSAAEYGPWWLLALCGVFGAWRLARIPG